MRKGFYLSFKVGMVNIKDVAEHAGVSITTVSHVINQTRFVSDELIERVNRAMAALDYHPNSLARSLRSGRTKTIGLIIPDISNQFFAEVSRKIEDKGFEYGYSVILCNTDDNNTKEKSYIDVLVAKQVDGIVFISAGEVSDNLMKPFNANVPIVIADRDVKEIQSDIVLVDNYVGGYEATQYLVGLGHQRIGCITGPSPVTPSAQRLQGFKDAMDESGLQIDPSLIVAGDFRYQSGETAMQLLLGNPQPPTAVFVFNDMMALGAIRAVYNKGLKVPEDLSLIGFDDIPLSRAIYPTLTTMAQPIMEMANLVVDLLVEKIRLREAHARIKGEKPEYQRIVMNAKLIERESCRAI